MKNLKKYNWANGILLTIFIVLFGIDLGNNDIISALGNGLVAIFNMFLILLINQRKIIDKLENKE
jgi:hypothetical protein